MREPPSSPGDGRKPGQSATPCAQAPPADPTATRSLVAPLARSELGALAARRVATASESKAAAAPAWLRQVRSSHARAGAYDQRRTCRRGRTRISPATSRILLGALVWKSASGEAHRRHRASRRTRSWRGAPQRRRAGWSCFVDRAESADRRHGPVWTVLLGRAAAAARRPSRACASRPTRACGVPLGSRQLAIET
jgi:hypothetical protein